MPSTSPNYGSAITFYDLSNLAGLTGGGPPGRGSTFWFTLPAEELD